MLFAAAAAVLALSFPLDASQTLGAGRGRENAAGFDETSWREEPAGLPAWPEPDDLVLVPLPPRDTLRLYLDARSLARGADGVVRYSLIVESPGGARNVLFEGIRCDTREYKTYAIGGADGRWRLLEKPSWHKIPYFEVDAFRHHLYRYVLCDTHSSPRPPHEVVRTLESGLPE